MKKQLTRTKQCAKCPWKVSTDPHDIPHGYSEDKHLKLACTIAEDTSFGRTLNVMACHDSVEGEDNYCIGWLHNQLGPGNNIGLRLKMRAYDLTKVKVFGKQHDKFVDTLPNTSKKKKNS